MLCLLTSNVQYLNNSASWNGPGSWREDRVKAQHGERPTCSLNITPRLAPDTVHAIWSSWVRLSHSRGFEWNTQGPRTFPSHFPSLTRFAQSLPCVTATWTFRCSVQLALFGVILWFCIWRLWGEGDVSRMPSRTSVELLWNSIHSLWYPWHDNLAEGICFYSQEAWVWEASVAIRVQAVLWTSLGLTFLICEMGLRCFLSVTLGGYQGQKSKWGTSLVVQQLKMCLSMQGTWVTSRVQEDPTCCGARKPEDCNY